MDVRTIVTCDQLRFFRPRRAASGLRILSLALSFLLHNPVHAGGFCERVLSWLKVPPAPSEPRFRLAWLTDIHLDHVSNRRLAQLIGKIRTSKADAVVISGDIATARSLESELRVLEVELKRPIYFVLGNHDYYHGDVRGVRERAYGLSRHSEFLRWLPAVGVVPLSDRVAMVGVDGWGDARLGEPDTTEAPLSDFKFIANYRGLTRQQVHPLMRALGDESALRLENLLLKAFAEFEEVFVITHVPPFAEASRHRGKVEPDSHLPYFACRATGDVLRRLTRRFPDKKVTVLCGHTHSAADVHVGPNLHVIAGRAVYRQPRVQGVISVPLGTSAAGPID